MLNSFVVRCSLFVVSLIFLASCDGSLNADAPGSASMGELPIVGERTAESFMPDAEAVEAEEDFSKDPQFETVSLALEALHADNALETQSMGADKIELRTHTFSNGETYSYSIYNGLIFNGDVILGTSKELQDGIAAYEAKIGKNSEAISTQGAMYKSFCASQFLFVCNERWGGGWPGGKLYVDTDSLKLFTSSEQTIITNALTTLDRATDITVGYRTTGDRVKLTRNTDGCYAVPGRSSKQPQNLNLSPATATNPTCINTGTVLHEFGHALGLMHEHQRSDRDVYIVINKTNLTSKGLDAVNKKYDHESRTPYDYRSIMHYPQTTTNPAFVKSTREPMFRGINYPANIYGGSALTARDIEAINTRY